MTTKNIKNEDISALMDGESGTLSYDAIVEDLRLGENREVWDAYHQIGDALRSEEMTRNCSASFNVALFTRLAAEPVYLGTGASYSTPITGAALAISNQHKILATRGRLVNATRVVSGLAAASAAIYFGSTVLQETPGRQATLNGQLAGRTRNAPEVVIEQPVAAQLNSSSGLVMRNPQIDAYLIAHQRYSPSLSSTAQFARSANFTTDVAK